MGCSGPCRSGWRGRRYLAGMQNQCEAVASAAESHVLRHVRRALESELIAFCATGQRGTQAHVGRLELLAAVGAELDHRSALHEPPPYVDLCVENGVRLSFQIRVF